MDDTTSWLPESHAKFGSGSGQEVKHLLVLGDGVRQVDRSAFLSRDQVVAVDSGWHSSLWQAGRDELQHSHLSSRVLHRHAVRAQLQVGFSTNRDLVWVVQVAVHDLF